MVWPATVSWAVRGAGDWFVATEKFKVQSPVPAAWEIDSHDALLIATQLHAGPVPMIPTDPRPPAEGCRGLLVTSEKLHGTPLCVTV